MLARLSAFIVWTLVAATTAYWGLRVMVPSTSMPPNATAVGDAGPVRGDWSRLMGAEEVLAAAAVPAISTRFQLLGVVAGTAAAESEAPGVALISIDGKPPRAFRTGARIEDDLVLKGLSRRMAAIGPSQGAVSFTLELPTLPEPARGTLPAADGIPGGISVVPPRGEPVVMTRVAPPPLGGATPMHSGQVQVQPGIPAQGIPSLNVVDVPGLAPQ